MKKQFIKITGYTWLAIILILVFGFVGCGGNNQEISGESTEEVIPIEELTEEMIPTEEPTEEVIPTEEPTEKVIPTEEPTEEVIPTVVPTDSIFYLPPIVGEYSVSGLDPDFNNYEGELEITASQGRFLWNWLDRERDGIGIFQENVVSVAWLRDPFGSCSAMSYAIQEDGVLDGFWIVVDTRDLGTADATPVGEMDEGIEGTYESTGLFPTGGAYSGELEITRNGDVYDLYWDVGWAEWYGVGIQRGNILSIAYTHRKNIDCMVVSYLIEDDGTLDGVWAYVGGTELGTDVAIPETSE